MPVLRYEARWGGAFALGVGFEEAIVDGAAAFLLGVIFEARWAR